PPRAFLRNIVLFFFQAEDGIRDGHVTGVQTCALPIFTMMEWYGEMVARRLYGQAFFGKGPVSDSAKQAIEAELSKGLRALKGLKIGRASCRERVEISLVAGSAEKETSSITDGQEVHVV